MYELGNLVFYGLVLFVVAAPCALFSWIGKLDARAEALEKEVAWLKGRLEGTGAAKTTPQRQGSVYRLDADR